MDVRHEKRSWLAALLAFLYPARALRADADIAPHGAAREEARDRKIRRRKRGAAAGRGPKSARSGDELYRAPDEALSARADSSGIRFWPSDAQKG